MLIPDQFKIIRGNPAFQVFQRFDIRVDLQFWLWVGFSGELLPEKIKLVFIDVGIDDFMIGSHCNSPGDLCHDQQQPRHLYLIETMPQRQIVGALVTCQKELFAEKTEGMRVHTGIQAGPVPFSRIHKGHYFAAVVNSLTQIFINRAKLIDALPLRVSPVAPLCAIAAPHIVFTLAERVVQPCLVVIGVGIPGITADGPEIGSGGISPEIAEHFGDGCPPMQLLGGKNGKGTVADIVYQIGIDYRQAALACAGIIYPLPLFDNTPT